MTRRRTLHTKLFVGLAAVAVSGWLPLEGGPALASEQSSREALSGEDVTIIEGEDRTIFEYRQNGALRFVRIVPNVGRPYYLVPADPTRGFGDLERADQLVPSWRIVEF